MVVDSSDELREPCSTPMDTRYSRNPFDQSSDGRALLLVNGRETGLVTLDEFLLFIDQDTMNEVAVFDGEPTGVAPCIHEVRADEHLSRAIGLVASNLKTNADQLDKLTAITVTLLSRVTDPSHLTVVEVARIEGVTEKTVRNRISKGKYVLEGVPGTRRTGIPTLQVFSRWMEIGEARELLLEMRNED